MLSLSRRSLLAAVSSMLVPREAGSTLLSRGSAPIGSGRITLGLCGVTYYNALYQFINAWKCGGAIEVFSTKNGGVNYTTANPPGTALSAWDGYLDANGELANPLPSDATHLTRIFYAQPIDGPPAGFSRTGDRWVLKWDGTAKTVTIALDSIVRVGNRITGVWGDNTSNKLVRFTGIDHKNPPRNIRLCEARLESRLDAGEIFHPDWVTKVAEGSGIVRFMDMQITNNNRATVRYSDVPSRSHFSWAAGSSAATSPGVKGGVPVSVISSLANEARAQPWVCIPHVFGTYKTGKITGITTANPAVVRAPGHNFSNGDKVIPYVVYGMTQVNRNTYTVANVAPGESFELLGVDSRTFGSYASGGWLTSPYDLSRITTEVTLFAKHFRDTVNVDLVTYYELSNEIWNAIFDAFHWLSAQAHGQFPGDNAQNMAGYLAAHCMKIVRDVYGANNRHRWKGVLATQTVNTGVTNQLIAGVKNYLAGNAPTLTVSDLFDDLAVAGYFGGNFSNPYATITRRWMNTSTQRWTDGLEPTKYSYFNRIVNEDVADARHTGMAYSVDKIMAFWKAQKAIADANGLGLIQYEGGNHNCLQGTGMTTDAQYLEFYPTGNHTHEDATNYTAMFNNFIALGGKYPAKFVEAGPVTRFGAWGGVRYLGDRNPVWDAVVKFNGRA